VHLAVEGYRAIKILEMSVGHIVELEEDAFAQFVMT
jgi:hypothetical protein